jgi:hypothetical protein
VRYRPPVTFAEIEQVLWERLEAYRLPLVPNSSAACAYPTSTVPP